ncbi:MAG: type II transport protein GspH [Ideonella sp.]|nr:type II transport protein GspH [Ideonella sp.]MCC7457431.1 GspH/FimT family pseudopilin [Nitrospira sp.]
MSNTAPAFSRQRGVTLVEAMSVLAILSIVIGSALPSFASLRQRANLRGVAAQLATDLQFARSQAVALNTVVRFSLHDQAGGTCYMVHTGSAANCSCGNAGQPAGCRTPAELLRSVSMAASGDTQVRANVGSLLIDPVRGTVTPTATLRIEGRDGRTIHQVVSLVGRVRSCSPQGLAGERRC